jgi:hypothetical protein
VVSVLRCCGCWHSTVLIDTNQLCRDLQYTAKVLLETHVLLCFTVLAASAFATIASPALQLTRLLSGTQQLLDRAGGYFADPALPLRHDEISKLAPQHVMAAILQDAAHSSMLRLGAQLAAVAQRLAALLRDPEAEGGSSEPSKLKLRQLCGCQRRSDDTITCSKTPRLENSAVLPLH